MVGFRSWTKQAADATHSQLSNSGSQVLGRNGHRVCEAAGANWTGQTAAEANRQCSQHAHVVDADSAHKFSVQAPSFFRSVGTILGDGESQFDRVIVRCILQRRLTGTNH